jgi:hypothetical protein
MLARTCTRSIGSEAASGSSALHPALLRTLQVIASRAHQLHCARCTGLFRAVPGLATTASPPQLEPCLLPHRPSRLTPRMPEQARQHMHAHDRLQGSTWLICPAPPGPTTHAPSHRLQRPPAALRPLLWPGPRYPRPRPHSISPAAPATPSCIIGPTSCHLPMPKACLPAHAHARQAWRCTWHICPAPAPARPRTLQVIASLARQPHSASSTSLSRPARPPPLPQPRLPRPSLHADCHTGPAGCPPFMSEHTCQHMHALNRPRASTWHTSRAPALALPRTPQVIASSAHQPLRARRSGLSRPAHLLTLVRRRVAQQDGKTWSPRTADSPAVVVSCPAVLLAPARARLTWMYYLARTFRQYMRTYG